MLNARRKHVLGGPVVVKRARVYRESDAQMRFVAWLRARPAWKVTRVENEGKRTWAQTARARAMGMTGGDADLILIHKSRVLWVEMKAKGGRLSPAQENVHAELRARGQTVVVLWSYDEAVKWAEGIERESLPKCYGCDQPIEDPKRQGFCSDACIPF